MARLLRVLVVALLVVTGNAVPVGAGETFPGDNGRILFFRYGNVREREGLRTMKPDGTGRRKVLNRVNVERAEISPDGTRIAYIHEHRRSQVHTMDIDGSNRRTLTTGRRAKLDPTWSPDGSQILFTSRRYLYEGGTVLHVVNADGSGRRRLTTSEDSVAEPTWSPDGERIAYACPTRKGSDICEIGIDGTGQRTLLSLPGNETQPDYSPDGASILLLAERNPKPKRFYIYPKLYVADIDGSNGRYLTRGKKLDTLFARWSPDGDRIAFINSGGFGPSKVKVIDANGDDKRTLDVKHVFDFIWSPNSNKLTYGPGTVLAVNVNSGRVKKLAGRQRAHVGATSWQALP
ncbi:MAG: hypothetical protein M3343_05375 [Actinomycetota bacterium]|nr:hypothetical protein [Actinomycetota bacterium]